MSTLELLEQALQEALPFGGKVVVCAENNSVEIMSGDKFVARGVHREPEKAIEACARAFLISAPHGPCVQALRERVLRGSA